MAKKTPDATEKIDTTDPLIQPLPQSLVAPTVDSPDPFAHVGDEHWGQGGRYIVVDGQRVPAPLTTDTEALNG